MKPKGLVYLAVAILVILAGWIGWEGYRITHKPEVLIQPETLQMLQDSLKTVKADLNAAGDMVATLRTTGAARDRKVKLAAATIADLSAKLGRIEGGGPALPDTGGWSVYQDKYLTAFFKQAPDTGYLSYSLAVRPLKVSLIEDLNNTWSAYATDLLDNVPVPIDTFDVQRNSSWQPVKPWYRKVGTVLKYTGVAAVAGTAGYLAGRIW